MDAYITGELKIEAWNGSIGIASEECEFSLSESAIAGEEMQLILVGREH